MLLLFKLTNTTLCKSTKFPIKLDTVESGWSMYVLRSHSQTFVNKYCISFSEDWFV